jgi:FkbM family methyltransferase
LAGLGHAYPLKSGCALLANTKPLRRRTGAPERRFARLRNGDRLLVDLNDYVGRTVYYIGDYDPKITWLCRHVLRRGDTMLDVGANMGVVTEYASKLVGPAGRVHAVEPQPALVDQLRRSVAANGRGNVVIHPVALSDADAKLPLYGHPGNLGSASLGGLEQRSRLVAVVDVRHSGTYLASLRLPPIRLLKIDVEGHEERFFRGALEFLAGNRPAVIIFESHGSDPFFDRPVVRLLASLSYDFLRIPKAKLRMRLHSIAPDEPLDRAGFDFVAVLRGTDVDRELRRWVAPPARWPIRPRVRRFVGKHARPERRGRSLWS